VELRDGTLVSCSSDKTAKRWSISHDNNNNNNNNNNDADYDHSGVRLLTTYVGHQSEVMSVAEKDTDSTIVTAGRDNTLKVWNTKTGECLQTLSTASEVLHLLRTKNGRHIACLRSGGSLEIRRVTDLVCVSECPIRCSLGFHRVCELDDCSSGDGSHGDNSDGSSSFVVASQDGLKRLSSDGRVLQSFNSKQAIGMTQVNRNTLASVTFSGGLKLWSLATGECIREMSCFGEFTRVISRLVNDQAPLFFVTTSRLNSCNEIRVWNERGDCIQTIRTLRQVHETITLNNGSVVIVGQQCLEVIER